ncbi:MAG TPA: valine--tRNA ligase [Vicinamibacterales bacterium]|nr:valine--tRNA ligase [Vicinamibacterales bacterium]
MSVPDKPALEGLEAKWMAQWEQSGVYRFDRSRSRADVYSIDTPPPTVSGSLHVGHVFSYTHTDIIARFKRMSGKVVFYPMGWDDNGLPTERRVQNFFGVRCDPSLPYDPNFQPPSAPPKPPISVSRPNFVELCTRLTVEDEKAFEALWRRLGLSVDWGMTYATIGDRARRVSQVSFLRLLKKGLAYQIEAPTLWDVDFRTAVAQAELEDREQPGAYHRIHFPRSGGSPIAIETTRPELIPACVALVAHPDDERYRPLFGTEVETPLFGVRVPVKPHALADPEKGSGIAMICTFGDVTDVVWWRELKLPVRAIIQPNGALRPLAWGSEGWESVNAARAQQAYDQLTNLSASKARAKIVELLKDSGDLVGDPRPITHAVKFFEKGDRPLEIISSRQWFVKSIEFREVLLRRAAELKWHPAYMQARLENWINGLNGDWCVSRQRFFGVPFPVWYPVLADGSLDHAHPIVPAESRLPIDPSSDVPDGYRADQRDRPGGFSGDPDVMDTWATSSLSPQVAGGWLEDDDLFSRVFPMDVRPQAHDIIRTWLFSTVLRSELEFGKLPWTHAAISGWVIDPDRKKMSKSKGNVVTPMGLLEEHGSDGVRYWAASARPGTDTAFDPAQMKVGRRLAIKLLNASKFVLARTEPRSTIEHPIDVGLLTALSPLVTEASARLEDEYDYAWVLQKTESFFWDFCDNYLELVKSRRYGDFGGGPAGSANSAMIVALSVLQRLFAPYLPFVADEIWSWWQEGSVHRASWPTESEIVQAIGTPNADALALYIRTKEVLGAIRKRKSEQGLSAGAQLDRVIVRHVDGLDVKLRGALQDLTTAVRAEVMEFAAAAEFSVEIFPKAQERGA